MKRIHLIKNDAGNVLACADERLARDIAANMSVSSATIEIEEVLLVEEPYPDEELAICKVGE